MKKIIVFLLALAIGIGLTGCSNDQKDPGNGKAPQKTLVIGVMPDVESVPFVIAEKNGYFEKEGVQVKIEHFKSAKDRDSALQGGKLDGVVTDIVAVVFSNEGGVNLKIISENDGEIKLISGQDSGINSLEELKGKSIGISSNTIMEYTVDRMLEFAGINPEEVNKVAIPQLPTRLEMLQGGKIHGAILPDPLAGLGMENGAKILITTEELEQKAGVIAFTAQSLQEYPEEIKAVFKAYNAGVTYLQTEPIENYVDYIAEAQGFPAGIQDSMEFPEYNEARPPETRILADVVEWMKVKGLIEGNYEYKDLVDDQVLR
ncbi:MAG: ABC transporter substrate-binding protein [Syntrophomonadaceae bacterium]|nr:ABC transporter substrate-binding protein [Syntrophomonadaceae bacterium]